MTRPLNSDPLRNFSYLVTIAHPNLPSLAQMGFMAVSGIGVQNQVIPYREGGNNTTTRKMPGQSDFSPLSLSRGAMAAPVASSGSSVQNVGTDEMFRWLRQIFSVTTGPSFVKPGVTDFRVAVTVDVLAFPTTSPTQVVGFQTPPPIKARFQFYNAWPMGLSYSDLEAGGNAVEIENMTLAHEGWVLITASQVPGNYVSPSQVNLTD